MTGAQNQDDWDSHWRDYSDSAAANPAQQFRFNQVRALLCRAGLESAGPHRVLDIGCGTGELVHQLSKWFPTVELAGVEYSQTGVDLCRRKVPGAVFVRTDLTKPGEELNGLSEWASHAVCSEVLEHVDDPLDLLRNAAPLLAKGAWLVVTVPGGPRSAYDRHIGHRAHFSRARLSTLLTDAGFRLERVMAAGFPFHTVYRLLVLARGTRLIEDARRPVGQSLLQNLALGSFSFLFQWNCNSLPLGWQMIALARKHQH